MDRQETCSYAIDPSQHYCKIEIQIGTHFLLLKQNSHVELLTHTYLMYCVSFIFFSFGCSTKVVLCLRELTCREEVYGR
jgi:hypothetical protein